MELRTTCVVAGGGPAGLMLGYLLARAGVAVTVLEKHADFLRDFRGDTIHPSTMEALHELGLLDAFLRLPHTEFPRLAFGFDGRQVTVAEFSHLPVAAPFVALMPQWDFLDFLAGRGRRLAGFDLRMRCEALDLIVEEGRVRGVRAGGPEGPLAIRADLVVAADGRHSRLRAAAGLAVRALGAPIDVLWFRLSRRPDDPPGTLGQVRDGHVAVLLDRGDYWQCGYIVPKGGVGAIRARGLDAFRAEVGAVTGLGPARAAELQGWDDVKVLDVRVDRLPRWWREGFLAIGDAAHAMSPVGGVGVNLAVADAVAAANRLWRPLREGRLTTGDLEAVQARREGPVRILQRVQVAVQDRILRPVLAGGNAGLPLPLRLMRWFPALARLPGRAAGLGLRMEHVAPEIRAGARQDGR